MFPLHLSYEVLGRGVVRATLAAKSLLACENWQTSMQAGCNLLFPSSCIEPAKATAQDTWDIRKPDGTRG